MKTEVGLTTDMFFHSSEYCTAINTKTQYYQKEAPHFLCSTAKRLFFRAAGKGAHVHVCAMKVSFAASYPRP